MAEQQKVAKILVESLYNAGVRVVFGIPGAKVDSIFDTLEDHAEIKLVICRHEQNAAFMAAAVGRITATPGVCIATSGPGAGNLTTGLVTATTEGDPVVAIVGSVNESFGYPEPDLQVCSEHRSRRPGGRSRAVGKNPFCTILTPITWDVCVFPRFTCTWYSKA